MPSSKIKPEDTPKAKEILLKIEESKILVKKITTEALATPTSEELVKDKINSVLKSCKDFLSDYGTNYQDLIKSSYNGLRSLANRCLNEVQAFFKNNKDNLLARNLAQAFAKSDKPKKTVNRTFVINGGEATLEEDMSVKFKETSGEFGYDQMIIDDYQARVKEAINTISKQTLTEKTYREVNGRKVGAPVFVSIRNKAEMAVRYDAMKEELKELVADKEQYVIVSQHADASLRCSPLQGLLYKLDVNPEDHIKVVLSSKELGSKKPKEIGKVDGNPYYSLKEAMSYGLFSYNCRHRFIKYIPGQKITPQYQYDSKAAEAKREIDTNMRTLERQIRMLKEREVLSLDPKERKAYIKASKQAQAKYRAYAQKHGRVINEWRCSITRSERTVRKLNGSTRDAIEQEFNIPRYSFVNDVYKTDEYKECLKQIGINKKKINAIYKGIKKILSNESAAEFEGVYLVDLKNPDKHFFNASGEPTSVNKPVEALNYILEHPNADVLTIHNHRGDSVPSSSDIFALTKFENNRKGIVVGNNGSIYYYEVPRRIDKNKVNEYNKYEDKNYSKEERYDKFKAMCEDTGIRFIRLRKESFRDDKRRNL